MKLQAFQNDLEHIERLFTLLDVDRVAAFLENHPFLLPLLSKAEIEIRPYFPDSELYLDVSSDPEWPGDSQLVMYVSTNSAPEQAVEALDRFDSNWWLDALPLADGNLYINLRYL